MCRGEGLGHFVMCNPIGSASGCGRCGRGQGLLGRAQGNEVWFSRLCLCVRLWEMKVSLSVCLFVENEGESVCVENECMSVCRKGG